MPKLALVFFLISLHISFIHPDSIFDINSAPSIDTLNNQIQTWQQSFAFPPPPSPIASTVTDEGDDTDTTTTSSQTSSSSSSSSTSDTTSSSTNTTNTLATYTGCSPNDPWCASGNQLVGRNITYIIIAVCVFILCIILRHEKRVVLLVLIWAATLFSFFLIINWYVHMLILAVDFFIYWWFFTWPDDNPHYSPHHHHHHNTQQHTLASSLHTHQKTASHATNSNVHTRHRSPSIVSIFPKKSLLPSEPSMLTTTNKTALHKRAKSSMEGEGHHSRKGSNSLVAHKYTMSPQLAAVDDKETSNKVFKNEWNFN